MAAIVSAIIFSFQMMCVYCYFNKNICLVKNIYYFTRILTAAMAVQANKNVLSIRIRTESTLSGSLQYSLPMLGPLLCRGKDVAVRLLTGECVRMLFK